MADAGSGNEIEGALGSGQKRALQSTYSKRTQTEAENGQKATHNQEYNFAYQPANINHTRSKASKAITHKSIKSTPANVDSKQRSKGSDHPTSQVVKSNNRQTTPRIPFTFRSSSSFPCNPAVQPEQLYQTMEEAHSNVELYGAIPKLKTVAEAKRLELETARSSGRVSNTPVLANTEYEKVKVELSAELDEFDKSEERMLHATTFHQVSPSMFDHSQEEKDKNAELQTELEAANTDIEKLQTDLSNLKLSDAAKKRRIDTLAQNLADEQNKNSGLKKEYDVLNAQYKQQGDKNAALCAGLEARITELTAERNTLMAENGDLKYELSKSQELASSEPHTTQPAADNEPVESDQRASGTSNERVSVMTEQKVADERDAVAAIERQIEATRQEVARVQADRHAVQQELNERREEHESSSDASSVEHLNNSFALLMTHEDTDIGKPRSAGPSSATGQVADDEEQRPESPRMDRRRRRSNVNVLNVRQWTRPQPITSYADIAAIAAPRPQTTRMFRPTTPTNTQTVNGRNCRRPTPKPTSTGVEHPAYGRTAVSYEEYCRRRADAHNEPCS